MRTCPCCSGTEYDQCCKLFHEGNPPKNALQLMRSRYSAYALNLSEYLMATTHPKSPHFQKNKSLWKRSLSEFSKNSQFHHLTILDFREEGSLATVTFTAYISQQSCDITFTERSYFEKIHDRWLYREGASTKGHSPSLAIPGPLKDSCPW